MDSKIIILTIFTLIICCCCSLSSTIGGLYATKTDCVMSDWSSCSNGTQTRSIKTEASLLFGDCKEKDILSRSCSTTTPTTPQTSSNSDIYILDYDYHNGQGYTNQDGEQLCKKYNGQYPTYNEMDNANKIYGAQMCAYGQFKDNAGLWMVKDTPSCGNAGYNSADPNRKWSVYCKGPIPNEPNVRTYYKSK